MVFDSLVIMLVSFKAAATTRIQPPPRSPSFIVENGDRESGKGNSLAIFHRPLSAIPLTIIIVFENQFCMKLV
ncbi:hypothetical protein ACTXT7_008624 [Hymenolepis weldensis]